MNSVPHIHLKVIGNLAQLGSLTLAGCIENVPPELEARIRANVVWYEKLLQGHILRAIRDSAREKVDAIRKQVDPSGKNHP